MVKGIRNFQASLISLSKRKRGRTERIQIMKKTKSKTPRGDEKKRNPLRMEKKKMLPYSAKKIRVNPQEPNSVLNPLTNSLSPSEKSYGVRLSSARKVGIQQYPKIGAKTNIKG